MQRNSIRDDYPPQYVNPGGHQVGPGLLEALLRFRWVVVGASIAAAVLAYGLSLLQPTNYQAEASMLLSDPRTSGVFDDRASGISDLSRYVRNQAEFVESSAVAARAAELLGSTLTAADISGGGDRFAVARSRSGDDSGGAADR